MEKSKVRQTRTYTEEYKKGAVKLAKEIGKKVAAVELGVPENTLNVWLNKAKNGEIDLGVGMRTPSESLTLAEELKLARDEIKRLARENSRIKEENEFLEEASAFFAASRQKLKRKNGSNL